MAMALAAGRMAKKKAKMGRPPVAEDDRRSESIAFRCRPAYKEWLSGLADVARLSPPDALDAGLVELAKKLGYPSPPKR